MVLGSGCRVDFGELLDILSGQVLVRSTVCSSPQHCGPVGTSLGSCSKSGYMWQANDYYMFLVPLI